MNARVLFMLSLAVNLVLGLFLVHQLISRPDSSHSSNMVTPPPTDPGPKAPSSPSPALVLDSQHSTPARTFTWEAVESPDYREYIANLRAIGCPEETIRDIIVADVDKLYAAKRREARGEPKPFEYWKTGNPWGEPMDAEHMAQARALHKEKLEVLQQLGIKPDLKMRMAGFIEVEDTLDTMFGFLPEDKQVSVVQMMQDMQAEMVEAAQDGGWDPEAMHAAQKDMEAALKEQLTPEEFRDYELRMSTTANTMRSQLAGWDPDEQEFLKVYELRKAHDDKFSMVSRGTEREGEEQERQEAEKQLNETIKAMLGSERYAAYERATDWSFQQIYQSVKRADLGTTEAVQVYDMRQAAEAEARELRNNKGLTQDQRNAALAGIQAETERAIKDVLGEKGWDEFDRMHNTYWLKNMVPNPQPVQE